MTATVATLREMLARLRRKAKGIDGPTALILAGLIDLAATQQEEIARLKARLERGGAFQADVPWLGPEPPAAQRLGIQACREADRAMLQTEAGREMVTLAARQLLAEDGCEHQPTTPCLVCVTRREWAIGAKV